MLSRMLCIGKVMITDMLIPKSEKQSVYSGAAR